MYLYAMLDGGKSYGENSNQEGGKCGGGGGAVATHFKEDVTAGRLTPTDPAGCPRTPALGEFSVLVAPFLPLSLHSL